jgi:hypothetical protein
VLLVPVVVSGTWWGYIGFDDCVDEREGPQVEIDVLRAAGETLAAAIDRDRAEAKLREAEATYRSIVETTPAITYQEHISKGYDVGGSVLYVKPSGRTHPRLLRARLGGDPGLLGRDRAPRTIATPSCAGASVRTARESRTGRSTG